MSIQELQEWTVLEQIDPFGEAAEYWRAAMIAATIANCNRSKNQRAFKPQYFMPKLYGGVPIKERTIEEQFAFFKQLQFEQNAIVKAQEERDGPKRRRGTGRKTE